MTDKELKRMSRAELLELLIELMEENERLRQKLTKANEELDERHIIMQRAGSIAKAALELNKVFEAADQAARQYVESVCNMVDKSTMDKAGAKPTTTATKAGQAASSAQRNPQSSGAKSVEGVGGNAKAAQKPVGKSVQHAPVQHAPTRATEGERKG